jgi:hypothetical protein
MPAGAVAASEVLVAEGAQAERDFALLSNSSSSNVYEAVFASTDLPRIISGFDQDYEALGSRLDDLG